MNKRACTITAFIFVDFEKNSLVHCLQAEFGSTTASQNSSFSATPRVAHSFFESMGNVNKSPGHRAVNITAI